MNSKITVTGEENNGRLYSGSLQCGLGVDLDGVAEQKMEKREPMAGINDEFEKMYRENFDDIYGFVYHQIRHRQMAEDITQDTFYAALTLGEEFLRHPKQRAWLAVTAQNKMYELYRKMKYWATEPLEEVYHELAVYDPNYEATELELAALAIISEEEWNLMKDYYLQGITARELAEMAGITENNLRVRLSRLKGKLRKDITR